MSTIEETIEVGVPVRAAYDQWTQFEEFPRFMEGVEEVRQLDDTHLHWRASVAGDTKEWDAEITEQVPERVIAWRATGGYRNAGAVHFEPVGGDRTKIHLQLDHEPEGTVEKIGDWLGMAGRRAKNDLERFREMIESRGAPSGGWRGEVHGGQPTGGGGFEPGTGMGTRATGPGGAETISEGTYGSGAYGENTISEQITDPIPPQGGTYGEPEAITMDDDIRDDTGMTGDRTGGIRTDIGTEREVHDVTEGPTPETREAMRRSEGEGYGGVNPGRDITEGPTPETRAAMEEDEAERLRRERGDRI